MKNKLKLTVGSTVGSYKKKDALVLHDIAF